tara:strand:+ start:6079 stop:7932 length:1854 start_codon:yes stop_codon:yes gene_type:complete
MSLKKPDNISQEQWDSLSETEKNDVWKEQGLINFLADTDEFKKVTAENGDTVLQEGSGEDLTGVSSLSGTNEEVSAAISGVTKQTDKTTEKGASKAEVIGFTQTLEKAKKEANLSSSTADPCGSKVNAIKSALKRLFKTLRDIKKYGGEYVNGITNTMANIRSLIKDTASVIASALRNMVQRIRNFIVDKITKAIDRIVDKIFTSLTKSLKDTIVQKVVDALLCKFTEILNGLGDFVGNFLKELVGKVVSIPLCAAQQFTNALINNLAAKIDTAIAPILDGIGDMIGGIGKIAGSVFSAIDTILGFESYLCLPKKCPEVNAITLDPSKLGPIKTVKDKFDGFSEAKIPTAVGVAQSVTNYIGDFSIFGTKLGDMPEADSSDEYKELNTMVDDVCNANSLRCGPPTIEIFGGGGTGAIASAVVDELGHVIAASLEENGSGYTSPPFVAILDSCDIGQGASAYSELNDDGEIERIVIVNTGNGYSNQPISGGGIASDYIVCLDGFEIISTGIGYAPTDEIAITPDIPNLEVSVQMNEEGQIVQMQVLNSVCGIIGTPELEINSLTGAGIEVRPILSVSKIESSAQIPDRIVDVDISADKDTIRNLARQQNIVRVIDCVS